MGLDFERKDCRREKLDGRAALAWVTPRATLIDSGCLREGTAVRMGIPLGMDTMSEPGESSESRSPVNY